MIEKSYVVVANSGIHARPATLLVNAANKFSSKIELISDGKTVNLKSIMGVMSLGVGEGEQFSIKIEGEDEQIAFDAIENLVSTEKLAK